MINGLFICCCYQPLVLGLISDTSVKDTTFLPDSFLDTFSDSVNNITAKYLKQIVFKSCSGGSFGLISLIMQFETNI